MTEADETATLPPPDPVEAAKQALVADQLGRQRQAQAEINEVCARHQVALTPVVTLDQRGTTFEVQILPLEGMRR